MMLFMKKAITLESIKMGVPDVLMFIIEEKLKFESIKSGFMS
jgi:hypothetical protein